MEKNYVSYETALKLKELGFDEKCYSVYRNEQHIREEIVTNYGELSDDGYYELTVDSGCGILEFDEVYVTEPMLKLSNFTTKNSQIKKDNFEYILCSAPLVMDVVEWLCDKHNIIVTYVPDWVSPSDTKFHYDFKIFLNENKSLHKEWTDDVAYGTIKMCMKRGVEYVINNFDKIKNNNK